MSEPQTLPTEWAQTTLGEIAEIVGGSTPSRNESTYFGGRIIWLTPTEIPKETVSILSDSREKLTEAGFKESSVRWIPKGSVLLTSRASIGYVAIAGIDLTTNQGFASFIFPEDLIEAKFLAWWLRSQKRALEDEAKGTTFKEISKSVLKEVKFQFPPLAEQRRIVAAIEQQFTRLDAGIASLRQAQARLKRYRAAVLKAAVAGDLTAAWRAAHPDAESAATLLARILVERRARWEDEQRAKGKDPAKLRYDEPVGPDTTGLPALPEGWTWAILEQMTSAARPICYGILMPKENIEDGVPYVRVKDIKDDKIIVEALHKTLPEIAKAYARASLKPRDLLLTIRGTYGRVAEVPDEIDGANITQDTARLDVSKYTNHHHIAVHLRSHFSQHYFMEVARGVAVKGVNIGDVRLAPIALPPLAEQEAIVAEVERRLSVVSEVEGEVAANLKRAERLRQSISREAFAGRLVAQDPADEPASALLARIQAERAGREGSGGKRRKANVAEQTTVIVQRPDLDTERVPSDAHQLTLLAE